MEEEVDTFILTDPIYRDIIGFGPGVYSLKDFNFDSENQPVDGKYFDDIWKSLGVKKIDCYFERIAVVEMNTEINWGQDNFLEQIPTPIFRGEVFVTYESYNSETSAMVEEHTEFKVYLIGSQNEVFAYDFLLPNKIEINCLIHKNASGYGGYMSGIWKVNILKNLGCKYYATTIKGVDNNWNEGDDAVIERYQCFGPQVHEVFYSHEERAVLITVENVQHEFKTKNIVLRDRRWSFTSNRETNSDYFGINLVPDSIRL